MKEEVKRYESGEYKSNVIVDNEDNQDLIKMYKRKLEEKNAENSSIKALNNQLKEDIHRIKLDSQRI